MSDDGLDTLFEGLERQIQQSFERASKDPESGTALVVSCSMAHCQHDRSLWPIDPLWQVCPVTTLGAQTWDYRDGQQEVDETLSHLTANRDVRAVLVVGHTGCNVLADAHERSVLRPEETGVDPRLDSLVTVVGDALDAGVVDSVPSDRQTRSRLVEYAVIRQVTFLSEHLPSTVTVVGYVHDQDGVYDPFPGTHQLVTVDGATDAEALRSRLPDDEPPSVGSLCQ